MKAIKDKPIAVLTLVICALMVLSSFSGLFVPGFYQQETAFWQVQCKGQDCINLLFIAPMLLFTGLAASAGRSYAILLWAGTILYVIYTYLVYCFCVHFNTFFISYCLVLGLSFYALVYFLARGSKEVKLARNARAARFIGIYFLLVSAAFYFLWLSEIVPAIRNHATPQSITDAGLLTNPVHVLDLSMLLPGIFITGVMILRKNRLGLLIAPLLLMFFVQMDITISVLLLIMNIEGQEASLAVSGVMGLLALLSLGLLVSCRQSPKTEPTI